MGKAVNDSHRSVGTRRGPGRYSGSAPRRPVLTLLDAFVGYAKQNNVKLEGLPDDPEADIPTDQLLTVVRSALAMFFPALAPTAK